MALRKWSNIRQQGIYAVCMMALLSGCGGTGSIPISTPTTPTTPTLSLSTTSLAFGNVAVNATATSSVTLTSTGAAPVTVTSAVLTGAGFALSGADFPVTLNSGQAATLTVQFDPKIVGAATGNVTVTSNSSTNPTAVISLSGTGTSGSQSGNSYSTAFPSPPAPEKPISENGNWINGGTAGLDWSNCQTTTGLAFGNEPGTINFDDSTCTLSGTWGPNQTAQITIRVGSTTHADFEEAEVRLRTTIAAHRITGYEINCSVKPSGTGGGQYMQIVRWNGGLGDFTLLDATSIGCANGDILKATISGSTITVYKNGSAILTAIDATYTSGQPGIGFYIQGLTGTASAANSEFGASAFSAND